MFVLMTVAVAGAALIGEWIEAATVVVLFALAQALERRSLDRARHAIRTLVADAPADVTRPARGAALERVRARRRRASATCWSSARASASRSTATSWPAPSDVNQAPITGESLPVPQRRRRSRLRRHRQRHGALDVRVTAIGDDTTLARIIHLVERAQAHARAVAGVGRSLRRALHAGGAGAGGARRRSCRRWRSARPFGDVRSIARWCCWSSPARARSCSRRRSRSSRRWRRRRAAAC